jgi:DNA-directed RNA polymerase specialized sigma24 family protein
VHEGLADELEGLSTPDIAERLGCTWQTARRKSNRLEDTLRRWAASDSG